MNLSDDLVHRGASAPDIVAACVASGSISAASGKVILSEIENSQARDIITTDPDASQSRSLSWTFQPMAGGGTVVLVEDITERRNAEARITPSGALRRTDGASQPGQFPRRNRAAAGGSAQRRATVGVAVRRPRSIQAGQRHPGPSLRRPAAVRRRRPAARDAAPGGFRGAVRRRRIRRVPAEHHIERGSRRVLPGESSIASASATRSTIIWSRSAPASASR